MIVIKHDNYGYLINNNDYYYGQFSSSDNISLWISLQKRKAIF